MKRISPWKTVRGRLVFLAVGLEALMLTVMIINSIRLLHGAMSNQIQGEAQQFSPVLIAALTAPLAARDYATMQAVVDESRTKGGLDYIVVVDRYGHRLATNGWPEDMPLPEPSTKFSLFGDNQDLRYHVVVPIEFQRQALGKLHFGINLSKMVHARQELLIQGVSIAAIEIFLSSVVLLSLGFWLTRHMKSLTQASLEVAAGNLSPAPVPEGDDDVGKLGAAFNIMSRVIKERVNELTAAKETAEASALQLRSITHSANDAILMMDPQGAISYWNPAAEKILGYCPEEAIGRNLHQLLAPKRYIAAEEAALSEFRRTGQGNVIGKTLELFAKRKDGQEISVALSLSSVFLYGAWHAVGILHDITERKLAEQALKQSDEKVRLLLNSTAEAILGIDLQGNCTFANPSSLRMLGCSSQEQLIGRNIRSLIQHFHLNHDNVLDIDSQIVDIFHKDKMIHMENIFFYRIDGTSFPVEYWSHPQVYNGVATGAVITFIDNSARIKAQEQIKLQQNQLESFNLSLQKRVEATVSELRQKDQILISQGRLAAMGEMIGNIAHQWRQPLNVLAMIITNLQLSYQDNELTGKFMDESVATANRLIQRMSATINDFSKFFSPEKESISFSAQKQVQLAVEMVEAAFKNNSITISVDSESNCNLEGFPNEYSQVLLNLLINAKDAIVESGSKQGGIHITIRKTDGMGTVTVRDNGCGIPTDLLDKIFDPYFSTKSMGTGIGLYMSKMIIERNMNGHIEVTTSEEGSEFLVSVPLAC
ncbi:PAS domain S-box protein [Desulfobulbus propionicus]|mgnify:CR=1 FL=1|nr:PAS domain S-box protein [Desulfobulbus sp.]